MTSSILIYYSYLYFMTRKKAVVVETNPKSSLHTCSDSLPYEPHTTVSLVHLNQQKPLLLGHHLQ